MKRHATDDIDRPDRTLCGVALLTTPTIDNAHPDCRRCLRVIAKRLRNQ